MFDLLKSHGMKNNIEGDLVKIHVFVIEDLISSGNSSLKAVNDLKIYGAKILGLGAIFTYGFQNLLIILKPNRVHSILYQIILF